MYRNDEISLLKNQVQRLEREIQVAKNLQVQAEARADQLQIQLDQRPPRESVIKGLRDWWSDRRRRRRRGFRRFAWPFGLMGTLVVGSVAAVIGVIIWAIIAGSSVNEGYVVERDYQPAHTTTRTDADGRTHTTFHPAEYNIHVCGEDGCMIIDRQSLFRDPAWAPGTYHCLQPPCDGPHDDGK